jgi:hypothetical protein
MPYTGKVSNSGIAIDTNNDGIPDGRAMTVKNAGNFDTFSLTNGVLTIQGPTGGVAIGGSNTQVQFNDGGSALGGHGGMVYDKTFSTNAGKLTVANLVISGNLTVSGTTTTVNTTEITLADNIIVLNSDATGPASANAGIEIERGDDANVQFVWDETNNQWDFDTFALGSVGKVYAAGSGAVYTFTSDTDTGIEHVGLNQLGLMAGNARVLMVNANGVHITSAGASGAGSNQALLVDNISIDTNTIASTNTNGHIVLAPNGTGDIQLDTDTVRVGDSGANATITTNGAGDLVMNTNAGTNSGSITIEDGANNDILILPNGTGKVGVAQATPTSTFHVGGDVTIAGGLTVAGTTTTVSSTNTLVADSLITLNEGETGAGVTGNIAGIEVDRGTLPIARFVWDDSTDNWRAQVQLSAGSATYLDTNLKCTGLEATTLVTTANVYVDDDVIHDGDPDTKIAFLTDQVQLYAGNSNGIDITAGSVVINEGSIDMDFRVESNGNANMLFVDGGNNRVGIGTASPAESLHVIGNAVISGLQYSQSMNLTGDLATGWHTIAIVEGRSGGAASGTGDSSQRAIGTFLIRNTDSSRHQSVMLTASHLFGAGNGNGISIDHTTYFSTMGIIGFRIKENSTYDGAVLQMNIANATNDIEVYLKNNFQDDGWELIQAVVDATDPSTGSLGVGYDNAYSTFSVVSDTDIQAITGNGQWVQGRLSSGSITSRGALKLSGITDSTLKTDSNGDIVAASASDFARTVTAGGNTLAATETLAFTEGANITITEAGGAVTIAASGGGSGASVAFKTISVSGQTSVVADAADDTLTLVGGGATTITTTAASDLITISSTDTDTTDALADVFNAGGSGVAGAAPTNWDPGLGPPSTVGHAIDRLVVYLQTHFAPTIGGGLP